MVFSLQWWKSKPSRSPNESSSSSTAAYAAANEGPEPRWWKRGEVIQIKNSEDWQEKWKFVTGSTNLVVVEFAAASSGPSRFIGPFIRRLAASNKDVLFVRLNYDTFQDVAAGFKVEVVPTFLLFKGENQCIDPIVGARRLDLSNAINQHKNK